MFWFLVLACGGAGDVPGGASDDATSIFDQEIAPAPPAETALTAPSTEDVSSPLQPAPAAAREVFKPSQKCQAARARIGTAEQQFLKLRNRRVPPVSDRVDRATEELSKCIGDVEWCGNRANDLKKAMAAAEIEFERVLDQVALEEAKLFPLTQDVESACGR